ncbi:MAG: class I SAM-dependent methyltransferase, partial [Myxococcota bacterium]
ARVVGIDFSARMIELARRHHSREGVSYIEASVLDLQPQQFPTGIRFDKVCMFESLQYFQSEQLSALLDGLLALTATRTRMYFSGVLDKERIWSFFNTPERRASYERQKAEGQEIMGHWWQRDHIATTAGARDLHCQFIAQDPALNTAHYRFDVVLSRE